MVASGAVIIMLCMISDAGNWRKFIIVWLVYGIGVEVMKKVEIGPVDRSIAAIACGYTVSRRNIAIDGTQMLRVILACVVGYI